MTSIRGHQVTFKIFENGSVVSILHGTSLDINQDSSFQRSMYIGQAEAEGDQVMEGWSGSADFEVKDAQIDAFIDRLVTANQNGIGVPDYTFLSTENYPDGTSRSYVYYGMQWKMSRSVRGMSDKVTKRLEFQAQGRKAL